MEKYYPIFQTKYSHITEKSGNEIQILLSIDFDFLCTVMVLNPNSCNGNMKRGDNPVIYKRRRQRFEFLLW